VAYNANVAYPFGCIGFHVAPRLEVGISTEKARFASGPGRTGISWRENLKRESELCEKGNFTTPPPGGCA